MAVVCREHLLASFEVQVKGVRLYQVSRGGCVEGTPVSFARDPGNPYDRHCVEVYLRRPGLKLGHVARRPVICMSQLLQGPYRVTGYVASAPYSNDLAGNWSWQYRLADVRVLVYGSSDLLPSIRHVLGGAWMLRDVEYGGNCPRGQAADVTPTSSLSFSLSSLPSSHLPCNSISVSSDLSSSHTSLSFSANSFVSSVSSHSSQSVSTPPLSPHSLVSTSVSVAQLPPPPLLVSTLSPSPPSLTSSSLTTITPSLSSIFDSGYLSPTFPSSTQSSFSVHNVPNLAEDVDWALFGNPFSSSTSSVSVSRITQEDIDEALFSLS